MEKTEEVKREVAENKEIMINIPNLMKNIH